jgi:hypothetical protein
VNSSGAWLNGSCRSPVKLVRSEECYSCNAGRSLTEAAKAVEPDPNMA